MASLAASCPTTPSISTGTLDDDEKEGEEEEGGEEGGEGEEGRDRREGTEKEGGGEGGEMVEVLPVVAVEVESEMDKRRERGELGEEAAEGGEEEGGEAGEDSSIHIGEFEYEYEEQDTNDNETDIDNSIISTHTVLKPPTRREGSKDTNDRTKNVPNLTDVEKQENQIQSAKNDIHSRGDKHEDTDVKIITKSKNEINKNIEKSMKMKMKMKILSRRVEFLSQMKNLEPKSVKTELVSTNTKISSNFDGNEMSSDGFGEIPISFNLKCLENGNAITTLEVSSGPLVRHFAVIFV